MQTETVQPQSNCPALKCGSCKKLTTPVWDGEKYSDRVKKVNGKVPEMVSCSQIGYSADSKICSYFDPTETAMGEFRKSDIGARMAKLLSGTMEVVSVINSSEQLGWTKIFLDTELNGTLRDVEAKVAQEEKAKREAQRAENMAKKKQEKHKQSLEEKGIVIGNTIKFSTATGPMVGEVLAINLESEVCDVKLANGKEREVEFKKVETVAAPNIEKSPGFEAKRKEQLLNQAESEENRKK